MYTKEERRLYFNAKFDEDEGSNGSSKGVSREGKGSPGSKKMKGTLSNIMDGIDKFTTNEWKEINKKMNANQII